MANKRMFTMKICDSDAFLEMPISAQCLYFHLNMRADDDGFVGNPKKIIKIIGANDDDLRILIAKRFLLTFEDGVIVIKHWRMHNTLSKKRYHETQYQDEKAMLLLKPNGSYSFESGVPLDDQKYIEMYQNQCDEQSEDDWSANGEQVENKRRTSGEQVENSVLVLDLDLDKDKDINRDLESKEAAKRKRFVKPTLEELEAYKLEKKLNVNCEYFLDFYESKGWMIGKNPMKDWKATMRGWSAREKNKHNTTSQSTPNNNKFHNFEQRTDDLDALLKNGRVFQGSNV